MLGAGYLHSFVATDRFKQNPDGVYQSYGTWGRPQAMLGFTLGLDRAVGKGYRVFTRVQTILQTPFVQGYIPILPINQLHLGITVPLKKSNP
jgi:predicted alternative tryptophan synthase beta-subunit